MNDQLIKGAVSVSDMAKALAHSRATMYHRIGTTYPYPLYNIMTRKPFYDAHLQTVCFKIRNTGIGWDGSLVLFNSPRKKKSNEPVTNQTATTNPKHAEFYNDLQSMGLKCTQEQVTDAIVEQFPAGIENIAHGVVIKDLFRVLMSK